MKLPEDFTKRNIIIFALALIIVYNSINKGHKGGRKTIVKDFQQLKYKKVVSSFGSKISEMFKKNNQTFENNYDETVKKLNKLFYGEIKND